MAGTVRSLSALDALLADNASGDISAQDARDVLHSAYQPAAINPGGRLTLTTGVPVTTSDVTGAGTLYYTPYVHNRIGLYDGTSWTLHTFAERSLSLTLTSGKNYDVFLYDNSGTLTLELSAAWTNDTTRADALATQDGVAVKDGATSRRWLGTIRASGSNTTEDSAGGTTTQVGGKRFVWNAYNRVARPMAVIDTTDTWTYSTNAMRQANAASGNKVEFLLGSASLVTCDCHALAQVANGTYGGSGIGLDRTNGNDASASALLYGLDAGTIQGYMPSAFRKYVGAGYHYLAWLECSSAGISMIFIGDGALGLAGGDQSGLTATLMG